MLATLPLICSSMAFRSIISTMLAAFLWPKRGTTKASSHLCSMADAGANDDGSRICAVCLSIMEGETGTCVLPCTHEFHRVCVKRWLAVPHAKNTCPICRFSMEEDPSGGGDDHKDSRRQECFTEEMVIWFSSFHVAGF